MWFHKLNAKCAIWASCIRILCRHRAHNAHTQIRSMRRRSTPPAACVRWIEPAIRRTKPRTMTIYFTQKTRTITHTIRSVRQVKKWSVIKWENAAKSFPPFPWARLPLVSIVDCVPKYLLLHYHNTFGLRLPPLKSKRLNGIKRWRNQC